MGDRSLRLLAWALCAITFLVLATSLLLILLGWSASLPGGATPWRDRAISLIGVVGAPHGTFDVHTARLVRRARSPVAPNSTTASDGAAPTGVATTAGTGVQASVFSGSADGSWASAAALVNVPPVSRSTLAAMRRRGEE